MGQGYPQEEQLTPAGLLMDRVTFSYNGEAVAVKEVSLELQQGELFCLLGPSGCGKSTLLKLLGGYLRVKTGEIWQAGERVTHLPPERRHTGMVFQNYALFPHLSALDNVAFALRIRGVNRRDRHRRAHELLDWVGLNAEERARLPSRLSGGQQQRVALARALSAEPSLLMLDEPFANLDRLLRERLREETRVVQQRSGTTAILVTHDREEAFALGERIGMMRAGRLVQVGTPEEVYQDPADEHVAALLGHRNILRIDEAVGGRIRSGNVWFPVQALNGAEPGGKFLVLADRVQENCLGGGTPGRLLRKQFAGGHLRLEIQLNDGPTLELQTLPDRPCPAVGEAIHLSFPPTSVRLLGRGRKESGT